MVDMDLGLFFEDNDMVTKKILITPDNTAIAVWQISHKLVNHQKSVFLTHGAFSDKRICWGIAEFLANLGYSCYILEWRGHGDSDIVTQPFDFETVALCDIKTVFDYLLNELHITRWHCITHSGGGICLTMLLSRYPQYQTNIQSMTLVACQAFALVSNRWHWLRLSVAKFCTKVLGFIPAKPFRLGTVNETYFTMSLWFDWNLTQQFTNRDKTLNYQQQMSKISIPVLGVCAVGDTIIAPVQSCQAFLNAFANPNNQLAIFGLDYGHLENYSHGRILLSRSASQEVWAVIVGWIEQHTSDKR